MNDIMNSDKENCLLRIDEEFCQQLVNINEHLK